MRFRPLAAGDVPVLAAMLSQIEPWVSYRVDASAWERLLRSIPPDELAYVALDDAGELVGYVQFRLGGTFALSGYIRTLAVRSDRHGRGLGRELLAFAEELILARGPNVFLLCSAANAGARAFYAAAGYEQVGELTSYVLEGQTEVIFRKTVGPIRK